MEQAPSKRVLLLHGLPVMPYRVPIYREMVRWFGRRRIEWAVAGPPRGEPLGPWYRTVPMTPAGWLAALRWHRPHAVVLFTGLRHWFLLPWVWHVRRGGVPVLYWGHGINLARKEAHRWAYRWLHRSCDALVLYGRPLERWISPACRDKVFVANNTLWLPDLLDLRTPRRPEVLQRYGITTPRNVVFTGRVQRRKRVDRLLDAHRRLGRPDVGLVLIGPDDEGLLPPSPPAGVWPVGPLYGSALHELMRCCDVACCPGAVGLGIVEAFACGLPFVTTDQSYHGPEIMYLHPGRNGLMVPSGSVGELAAGLGRLLDDSDRREAMGREARWTYLTEASPERFFEGFLLALQAVWLKQCPARTAG